jgi:hypothetical protein
MDKALIKSYFGKDQIIPYHTMNDDLNKALITYFSINTLTNDTQKPIGFIIPDLFREIDDTKIYDIHYFIYPEKSPDYSIPMMDEIGSVDINVWEIIREEDKTPVYDGWNGTHKHKVKVPITTKIFFYKLRNVTYSEKYITQCINLIDRVQSLTSIIVGKFSDDYDSAVDLSIFNPEIQYIISLIGVDKKFPNGGSRKKRAYKTRQNKKGRGHKSQRHKSQRRT